MRNSKDSILIDRTTRNNHRKIKERKRKEKKKKIWQPACQWTPSSSGYKCLHSLHGVKDIPINFIQGSHISWKRVDISNMEQTLFSCSMIHVTFCFIYLMETVVFFHAAAIVILAPVRMYWMSFLVTLEVWGNIPLSKAIVGDWCKLHPVTRLIMLNTLFQYPRIFGHSHHICTIDPSPWQPLKHRGEVDGYMEASLTGTKYHLV